MSDDLARCTDVHTHPSFTLKERRARVTFNNPDRLKVEQIRVDGCAITDNGLACDHLINVADLNASWFVELKGGDVEHAQKQLARSKGLLGARCHGSITLLVVTTGSCPRTRSRRNVGKRKARRASSERLTILRAPASVDLSS